jgi:hypothetical protein
MGRGRKQAGEDEQTVEAQNLLSDCGVPWCRVFGPSRRGWRVEENLPTRKTRRVPPITGRFIPCFIRAEGSPLTALHCRPHTHAGLVLRVVKLLVKLLF